MDWSPVASSTHPTAPQNSAFGDLDDSGLLDLCVRENETGTLRIYLDVAADLAFSEATPTIIVPATAADLVWLFDLGGSTPLAAQTIRCDRDLSGDGVADLVLVPGRPPGITEEHVAVQVFTWSAMEAAENWGVGLCGGISQLTLPLLGPDIACLAVGNVSATTGLPDIFLGLRSVGVGLDALAAFVLRGGSMLPDSGPLAPAARGLRDDIHQWEDPTTPTSTPYCTVLEGTTGGGGLALLRRGDLTLFVGSSIIEGASGLSRPISVLPCDPRPLGSAVLVPGAHGGSVALLAYHMRETLERHGCDGVIAEIPGNGPLIEARSSALEGSPTASVTISGEHSRGRLLIELALAGDVDGDGVQDVVVGLPGSADRSAGNAAILVPGADLFAWVGEETLSLSGPGVFFGPEATGGRLGLSLGGPGPTSVTGRSQWVWLGADSPSFVYAFQNLHGFGIFD